MDPPEYCSILPEPPSGEPRQLAEKVFQLQLFFSFSNAPNISWIVFGDVGQGTLQGSLHPYKRTNIQTYTNLLPITYPYRTCLVHAINQFFLSFSFSFSLSLSLISKPSNPVLVCYRDVAWRGVAGRKTPYPGDGTRLLTISYEASHLYPYPSRIVA